MKKISALLILVGSLSLSANAQWGEEPMAEKPSIKDRMFFGGGFGMNFSSYTDYVSVSPIVGYKLTPRVATGLSFIYRYTNDKRYTPSVSY